MKILIYCAPPPIPVRVFDYRAIDLDTYDGGKPVGYGATAEEAKRDLLDQLLEDTRLYGFEGRTS